MATCRWASSIAALNVAAPIIAAIYIAGTLSLLVAAVPHDINPSSGVMDGVSRLASRFGWSSLTPFVALLVAVSCIGSGFAMYVRGRRKAIE